MALALTGGEEVLREAGLIDCERRGTWVYYWTRTDRMNALMNLLQSADAIG